MEVLDRPPGERDSHDLSLHFTRFSVVDSMLTSLSDFPSATTSPHHSVVPAYPDFDVAPNDPSAQAAAHAPNNIGRRRGRTQSSSMSTSDYDLHVDEIASRYNAYHSRGRQNSIYSNRRPSKAEGKRKQSNASIRTTVTATKDGKADTIRHTRGTTTTGKGSKSSGSSSMDMGYVNALPNASFHNAPNRAASFDHSYGDRSAALRSPQKAHSSMMPSVPLPVDYSSMDAAPMPTVPAGPRRPQDPLSPMQMTTPKKSAPSRRNSVKSTAGKSVRRSKSSLPIESGDIRDQAKQFVHATNNMRTVHSGAPTGPAPSPNVGALRKAYPPAAPPKEKTPGFFRRVFGSSKHSQAQHVEEAHRPPSPAAIRQTPSTASNRPRTQPNQQHQSSVTNSRPSTQEASRDPQVPPVPQLRKAHSSFFRRRKKSLTENDPPPVPPLLLPSSQSYAQLKIAAPQRSPGSQSLRGAMAQYLGDKATSPQDTFYDSLSHQASHDSEEIGLAHAAFSSERDQRNRDAGRTLQQLDRAARQGTNGDRPPRIEGGESPNDPTQDLQVASQNNMRVIHTRLDLSEDPDDPRSFLADSSSNEAMGLSSSREADDVHQGKQQQGSFASSSAATGGKENTSPPRRANIGEKRTDVHMLSPISDRSFQPSDSERPIRLVDDDDDHFLMPSFGTRDDGSVKSASSHRIWLEPSPSDEKVSEAIRLRLPLDGPRTSERLSPVLDQLSPTSESDIFASATSLPIVQVENKELRMSQDWGETDAAKAILTHDTDITESDRARAKNIFDGDEEYVSKAGAAAWLGQTTPKSARTRRAYMELFDWNGVNILAAFRELCGKLIVKAESQQLDRVIDAFSERWCNCNPNHGFKDRGK
jgi:hypothetical protein